ncbi:MAG: sulfatase [Actinomycetota bacterium]|nr:sulfatase [Actinomycetota bacterium]
MNGLVWFHLRSRIAELVAVTVFALLAAAGLAQVAEGKSTRKASAKKPNIVMIQVDDAIRDDIQHMPHVSRILSEQGSRFTNYTVPYPLCGPARASLLTGQLAHNNRMESNFLLSDGGHFQFRSLPGELNQANSLGPWLQQAGYRTALVGKYLNEYGAADAKEVPPGWDRWVGLLDNSTYDYFNYAFNVDGRIRYRGDRSYADKHVELARRGLEEPAESFLQMMHDFREVYDPWDYFGTQVYRNYSMNVSGGYAARFVRRQAPRRKPFFLYYAPPGPHAEDTNHIQGLRQGAPGPDPRPPARYRDSYDSVDLPRPPSFNEEDVSDKAANIRNLPLLTDEEIGTITDNYRGRLGALRGVDNQVKKITRALKKKGVFKDTYIIFASDNGYLQGEHRLAGSKFLPYENSVRVPLMMRGPGIKEGKAKTGTAMDVDLTATILDIAGKKPGRVMDGISLLPSAKGKKTLPARDVPLEALRPLFEYFTPMTAFDVPYYGVRTSRYKYINWSFGGKELYDLKADPDELENLARHPSQAGLVSELEAKASKLRSCAGSNCR